MSQVSDLHVPPQNIEAEKWVIGGILSRPDAMSIVDPLLSPEMFYFSAHGKIYSAMQALYQSGIPIDAITLYTELEQRNMLDSVGGMPALIDFASFYDGVNIDHHAAAIKKAYHGRETLALLDTIRAGIMSKEASLEDLLNDAQAKLSKISDKVFSDQASSMSLLSTLSAEIVANTTERWQARSRGETIFYGYPTGFYDYDAMTGGFVPQTLTVVAGRPSMGKTSWAVQAAVQAAKNNQVGALIFSLEMSKESLAYRIISSESKVSHGDAGITAKDIQNANLSQQGLMVISKIATDTNRYCIGIDDRSLVTPADIKHSANKFRDNYGVNLGIIVIDYLQLMGEGNSSNRVQELDSLCRQFKQIAKDLNVAVVLLSQLSRGVEARQNKRPILADLRESGAIEQNADVVLALYRDEYYNQETTEHGIAELILLKQRNGPVGTVKTLFEPRLTSFSNIQSQPAGF